jgi:hypothetical protein
MTRIKKQLPWWVKLMRYLGRGLVILWAVAVLTFVVLSVMSEVMVGQTAGVPVLIVAVLLLVGGAVIPWLWEGVGAFLLLGEAVFLLVFFLIVSKGEIHIAVLAALCLPPLIGGGLSLACWLLARKAPTVAQA